MSASSVPEATFLRFVDVARHQLLLLEWEEIEPSLAVSWGELHEPELPPWDSVAERVRCAAQEDARAQ